MKCFEYAFRGLGYAIKNERNMRVHMCFAFYVICAGFVCGISVAQWAAVLICIGLVTALECLNTAIEALCDEVCPEKSDGIKAVKDLSAGAVLCAAIAAAAVGGVVFFRAVTLNAAMAFLRNQPVLAGAIILTLVPAAVFVVLPLRRKGE